MGFKSINVEMTQELFDRSIKGSPNDAVKELIWNACDADATEIEVSFGYSGFSGAENVSDIFVVDNGCGIPFDSVTEYFGKYGRSIKTYSFKSPNGRVYHGKHGQGRYKSLAIGSFVNWKTSYVADDGKVYSYEIRIDAGSRMDLSYSEAPELSDSAQVGTVVHIHGIPDDRINIVSKLAENEGMIPEMLATFAPYLLAYREISINYGGIRIRPETQIEKQAEKEIVFDGEGNLPIEISTKIIRWKQSTFSKMYICGSSGVVYDEQEYTLLQRNALSLYLLGDHFEKMHRENTLYAGRLGDPAYRFFDEEARKFAREFTQEQELNDAAEEIQRIKDEGVYPFIDDPVDEIAKAEQSVFDVLAVEVTRAVPQLRTSHTQTKKLTYRLIKEAVNTNPASIKTILMEVFSLTQKQQDDLAELLSHTHLPEIIDMAKTISNRLTFIYLLDQMIYCDSVGKLIKERTQFHRLLLRELWIFGEKYALGTSDQSLKSILSAHIKCLGRNELIPEMPPEASNDLTCIPDICLFEQICPSYEHFEHLVIELKRPVHTLTLKNLDQIRHYALTVAENPLFDKTRTKWHFILIGQKFNKSVVAALKNAVVGDGNFYNAENVSISVLMWSSIIQDNKLKYEFLREKLNHQLVDDPSFAMDYLFEKHTMLFPVSNMLKKTE